MDLTTIVSELSNTVILIMDPYANPENRRAAYNACEDFKDSSPYCAQCGLLLCSSDNPSVVRHVGFQFIEHVIKFRWNDMTLDQKRFIKDNALRILSTGTKDLLSEEVHIKTASSRIIVEMIKREWPQHWPDMLQELNDICSIGETQKELVLLVFMQLAEDLHSTDIMPVQRKKDLLNALTCNLKALFSFFLSTLTQHHGQYIEMKNLENSKMQKQALVHCCVAKTALKTLGGFVEWVSWNHITADNNLLFRILCTLLGESTLCVPAINCLLLLVSRKGKLEDRLPLLILFDKDAMGALFAAASSASEKALQDGGVHYSFLKSVCQVLVELGIQLASLWGTCDGVDEPPTFQLYLNGIFTFTSHPSIILSQRTLNLWNCFFQHVIISRNDLTLQMVPEVVKTLRERLCMVGFPLKMDSPSCEFSQLDFDSDIDFKTHYSRFRSQTTDVLRSATHILPDLVFKVGSEALLKWLTSINSAEEQFLDAHNISMKLEAVATYLDCVSRRLFVDDKLMLVKTEGLELLTKLLLFKSEEVVMMQPFLSCMSASFLFLAEAPELIPRVLDKLFAAVVFVDKNNTMAVRSSDARGIRRHACACIYNICKTNTKLLLPFFDTMYQYVKALQDADELGFLEQWLLIEALVTLSNEFQSYEKQASFIKELLSTIEYQWLKITREMSSAASLLILVGLKEPPKPLAVQDEYAKCRLNIIKCINVILSIVRRCRVPDNREIKVSLEVGIARKNLSLPSYDDITTYSNIVQLIQVAENGGFCHNGNVRSPAAAHVLVLLDGVFAFIRCVNSLHEPAIRAEFHPMYSDILEMPQSDKNLLIGVSAHTPPQEATEDTHQLLSSPKIKNLLHYLYESSTQLLMHVVQSFDVEFYTMNDLPNIININLFSSLEDLPDFKLRLLLHNFLKPFIRFCPQSCYHVLIPVFQHLFPFMYWKLSPKWERFKLKYGTSSRYEDEMTENSEIYEDQLNRLLTREYVEVFDYAMRPRSSQINDEDDKMEAESQVPRPQYEKMSNLGIYLLRAKELRGLMICTLFNFLHWLDTQASLKSISLCSMTFRQLISDDAITKEEEVLYLLHNVLCGLKELGEHDLNQSGLLSLGLLIYDTLRSWYPSLHNVLLQDVGCKPQLLKTFDDAILQRKKGFNDKKKKDIFKQLVSNIIGKNVGEHYKNDIKIKNLSSWVFKPEKPKNQSILCSEEELGMCALFAADS